MSEPDDITSAARSSPGTYEPGANELRYGFLSQVTTVLGESLDYATTMQKISRLAVPALGDWCAVDRIKDETFEHLVVTHVDSSKADLLREMWERYPPRAKDPFGIAHVAQTRQPELHSDISEAYLDGIAHDNEHRRLLKGFGVVSTMLVPMISHGHLLGVMTFATAESGRRYSEKDLVFAEDLARRCAQALQNSLLFREVQEALTQKEAEIAERKKAEDALLQAEKRMKELNRELEKTIQERTAQLQASESALTLAQRMEAVGRLAGGVAHDFNNLLVGVVGIIREVQGTLQPQDPRHADLEQAAQASERAFDLTRRLLTFAKQQPTTVSKIQLNDVVQQTGKLLDRVIGRDVELIQQLHPELPLIEADRSQVEQVLMNLIINSRDAMRDGGRIEVTTRTVQADGDMTAATLPVEEGKYVEIQVRDTGPGIPPDILPKIFDPFFTTKEKGKGTGLGLSTVYGIVQKHRGGLKVETAPGKGTTFRVLFPLAS